MKWLAGLIGAVLLIAVGVGGTLGVQALVDDDPSGDCEAMNAELHRWVENIPSQPTHDDLVNFETVADIRWKVCQD